jgi:ubiquinone/menaquinone biosynthesis C-methylase UbiE
MALHRTLEPEVMDTEEEASDYDSMDNAQVNARFCDDLLALRPSLGRVLDAGTGTARIPVELCRRVADLQVQAIDLADSMLAMALRNVELAGLGARVHVERRDAKATGLDSLAFDAVVSNSLVHHIPDPSEVLGEMWRLVRRGGVLFVRDLARPESPDRVTELVATYAPIPDGSDFAKFAKVAMLQRQRALFEASLHAALTVDEVVALVAQIGIPEVAVQRTSDRHWTLASFKS